MALIKWEPFRDIGRFFSDEFPSRLDVGWDLAVDVYEEKGNVVAQMHLPGINPNELEVTIDDGYLRVSGTRKQEREVDERSYYHREIRRGSFERVVHLPMTLDRTKARATYRDGVLVITCPKQLQAKHGKITIDVAS